MQSTRTTPGVCRSLPALALVGLLASARAQEAEVLPLGPEGSADLATAVAMVPDGSQALIPHRETDNLTFFDVELGRVVATLAVGDGPEDVAVASSGRFALVANGGSDDVSLIAVHARREVRRIPVSVPRPKRVLLSEDGRTAVVGAASQGGTWSFSVLGASGGMRERLAFPTSIVSWQGVNAIPDGRSMFLEAVGVALTPDGRRLIVADEEEDQLVAFDTETGSEVARVDYPGDRPKNVVVPRQGGVALVAGLGSFAALDLATNTWRGSYPVVGLRPWAMLDLLPDGQTAVVSNTAWGVAFVDLDTGTVENVGAITEAIALIDGGTRLVSTHPLISQVIDTRSRAVVTLLPGIKAAGISRVLAASRAGSDVVLLEVGRERVGVLRLEGKASIDPLVPTGEGLERDGPIAIETLANGERAVTLNRTSHSLSVLDLRNRRVLADVLVGAGPEHMAVSPDGKLALTSNVEDDTVSIVDLTTGQLGDTLTMPATPGQILFDQTGQRAYVQLFWKGVFPATPAVSIQLSGTTGFIDQQFPWNHTSYIEAGMWLDSDGSRLFVAASQVLVTFDTATGAELGSELSEGIVGLLNPAAERIYTAYGSYSGLGGAPSIRMFDLSTPAATLLGTAPWCGDFGGLALEPSGSTLYRACFFGSTLLEAFDAKDLSVLSSQFESLAIQSLDFFGSSLYAVAYDPLVVTSPRPSLLLRFDNQGSSLPLQSTRVLLDNPVDMDYSDAIQRLVVPHPAYDLIELLR